ncbi:hypothetical protein GCM10023194_65380 [Planotetraspora phitsanulokensis]|uniref:Uncharacterized protein n=1 Tax=Planotetraspora phitsanulokensis TaxID=575192 RepID=A0A8J3XJJ2_9ACTN|nr:hypothetical protein [Planotetraspora phitsanulokensis]GII38613.1 hypothetical protein Pph01_36160 [Planotetraspora phitsanulokensis]
MGNHRGVSREELKHGTVVTVTVLLALGLVVAWSALIPGFMSWDDIVMAVIGSLRLTGPVAAAFAAWVAVRKHRGSSGKAVTPWRAVKAPLAILVVVTGSFGTTVLVLGLRAGLGEQPGRLVPSGLAMCVASLALYVVVGWIVGWLLPLIATPAIAGLGTYVLFTWLAGNFTWADRLAPSTREPYDLFEGMSTTAFTDQTLWLLGLSAALLLGWVALVTGRMLALAAAVIAVMAAGTGAARLVTEPQTVAASERLVYSCQEWPITVCVHPAMRAGLTELVSTFTTIAARLTGTPAAFNRVEQHSPDDGDQPYPGVAFIHVDDLNDGYADRAAAEFLDRLAKPCPATVTAGYRAIVISWLRNEPLPAGPLPEHRYAAVWFSELTETQRRDWLRMFYSDFVSCGLQSRHFGGGARQADPNMTGYPVHDDAHFAPVYPVAPSPGGYPSAAPVVPTPSGPAGQVPGGVPAPGGVPGTGSGTGSGTTPGPVPGSGGGTGQTTGPDGGTGSGTDGGASPAPGSSPAPGTIPDTPGSPSPEQDPPRRDGGETTGPRPGEDPGPDGAGRDGSQDSRRGTDFRPGQERLPGDRTALSPVGASDGFRGHRRHHDFEW